MGIGSFSDVHVWDVGESGGKSELSFGIVGEGRDSDFGSRRGRGCWRKRIYDDC